MTEVDPRLAWRGPPVWGYEATLVVSAADSDEGHFPSLIVGMAPLQRPGTNVGQSAVSTLASVVKRGHPAGWLGADRAYTNAKAEHFQLPARALGYSPVLDYKEDQLGVQGSYGGAVLIEGAFYCPAIPEGLKTATADHRADRIEKKVWEERIKARLDYQLRPNGRPDPEGHVRQLCPASHAAPTARCDLKPRSINTSTAGGTRIHLTPILKTNPPTICRQQSLTFPEHRREAAPSAPVRRARMAAHLRHHPQRRGRHERLHQGRRGRKRSRSGASSDSRSRRSDVLRCSARVRGEPSQDPSLGPARRSSEEDWGTKAAPDHRTPERLAAEPAHVGKQQPAHVVDEQHRVRGDPCRPHASTPTRVC